jgi:hypothetical protein
MYILYPTGILYIKRDTSMRRPNLHSHAGCLVSLWPAVWLLSAPERRSGAVPPRRLQREHDDQRAAAAAAAARAAAQQQEEERLAREQQVRMRC